MRELESLPIRKIISGGQTGVDRGALNAAILLRIPHGGWCPHRRRAEDGRIPDHYQLQESRSFDYQVRTEQNVLDADATLILHYGRVSSGTALTRRLVMKHGRPLLAVHLGLTTDPAACRRWLRDNLVGVLNVAGPRESSHPGIERAAADWIVGMLTGDKSEPQGAPSPT